MAQQGMVLGVNTVMQRLAGKEMEIMTLTEQLTQANERIRQLEAQLAQATTPPT